MNNKNLIIGGVVVAGLVAYYLYNKNKSNGGGISAPTGTASNNVENARAPIGGEPYHEPISYVPAPKPRTEEIVTASVPDARPIDIVVNPTIFDKSKYKAQEATFNTSIAYDEGGRRSNSLLNMIKGVSEGGRTSNSFMDRIKKQLHK